MQDLVVDRAVMTQEILAMLMGEGQKKLLIHLAIKPVNSLFLPPKTSMKKSIY